MERMKLLSNKKYDRLIIEIETLKEIRENDEMCINMMADRINRLEEENKNLNKQIEQFKKGVKAGTNIIERLEEENKNLKERVSELEDELWVWKHSYRKLMKDKKLYEKARAVMFGPEEEDLYEDVSCMEEDTLQELKDIGEI